MAEELIQAGYKFTAIPSLGGYLSEGNTTLLVGVDDADVPNVLSIFQSHCQSREQVVSVSPVESGPQGVFLASPVKVPVGGAVVFVLNVEQFERF